MIDLFAGLVHVNSVGCLQVVLEQSINRKCGNQRRLSPNLRTLPGPMASFFILISDMNVNCDPVLLGKGMTICFENSILPDNLFSRKQDMLTIGHWDACIFLKRMLDRPYNDPRKNLTFCLEHTVDVLTH